MRSNPHAIHSRLLQQISDPTLSKDPDPALAKLEEEGWSVEACSTGAQALERLRGGERFDVLIFGYKLPDMTGVELIRQTRALAHRQRTPLIMLTDYDVEDDALRAGATLFLRSSGAADSIAETVARLLARKKRTESGA